MKPEWKTAEIAALLRRLKPAFYIGQPALPEKITGRTPCHGRSGGLPADTDELLQRRNERLARDAQTAAQIIPECDAVLGAGLGKPKEAIPAIAPGVAASSSADLAAGHLAADVVLGAVGV